MVHNQNLKAPHNSYTIIHHQLFKIQKKYITFSIVNRPNFDKVATNQHV